MVVINKDTYIIYREKLDNGQIVHLEFSKYTTLKRTFYFVCLFINKRKKGYIENEQTGKCGLSGLIIAKNLLINFINKLKDTKLREEKISIIIGYTNSRRRDVYERYLKELNFIDSKWDRHPCLRYDI